MLAVFLRPVIVAEFYTSHSCIFRSQVPEPAISFFFFRYWPQISGLTLSFVDESSDGRGKDDSRPLVGVRTLCLLQCFDTVGWVTGVISDP